MESLSRPLYRNQASSATLSKKLFSGNGFSAKNAYDDVFSGPPKFRAPTFSSRVEDYYEIFGSSQASRASSIPILDLSSLEETNVSADARSSKLDYSKIFGGFRDEDIAVSYEEMVAEPKGGENFSEEARTPAKTVSPSEGSDRLNYPKENQVFSYKATDKSFDAVKQFNMSYHKTNQKSNDGTNGTMHIAQLHAVPGFTRFIDENTPLQKTECDKSVPSPQSDVNLDRDFNEGIMERKHYKAMPHLSKEQTSEGVIKFKSGSSQDGFYSNGKLFHEINPKTHPSKFAVPSDRPDNLLGNKGNPKRSMASNFEVPKSDAPKGGGGDCSPPFSDEEVDVNSAAAASAAALRKAIEKAQASIRIAKESMERKKAGLRSFSKPSSKDGLDVKERRENKVASEANRIKEKNTKGICERVDAVLQVFAGTERQNAIRSSKVAPDFKDSGKTFIAGETNGNQLESDEQCEEAKWFPEWVNTGKHRTATLALEQVDTHECESEEMKTAKEILEQREGNGKKAAEEAHEVEDMKTKLNVVQMAQEWEEHVNRLESAQEIHELEENQKIGVAQEVEEIEEKQKSFYEQEKCEKKLKESQEPIENEKFFECQDWEENDNEKRLDEAQECVENEKKQEVLEQEQNERILKDVHEKEENENRLEKICEQEIEKRQKEACEVVDYENKLKESCEGGINEKEEDDAHKGEDNELDKVHELEISEKRQNYTHDEKESAKRLKEDCEWEEIEKRLIEAYEYEDTESIWRETDQSEDNEKIEVDQEAVKDKKNLDASNYACKQDSSVSLSVTQEETQSSWRETDQSEDNEKMEVNQEAVKDKKNLDAANDACKKDSSESLSGTREETETIWRETDQCEGTVKIEVNQEAVKDKKNLDATNDACNQDSSESLSGTREACGHEENDGNVEISQEVTAHEESERIPEVTTVFCEFKEGEVACELEDKEILKTAGLVSGAAEHIKIENKMEDNNEAFIFNDNPADFGLTHTNFGRKQIDQNEDSELASYLENGIEILDHELGENKEKVKEAEISFDQEEDKNNFETAHEERQWVEMGKKMEASRSTGMFKGKEKTMEIDGVIKTRQDTEKNEEKLNITFAMEEKETNETVQKEVKVEKELLQKIDEANKRESEREKDRIAVERAIREVRERAFAEARERAERAAVERATAEARQRVMAEAREKFEKASAGTKSSAEKASIEAKLRAERAAVERATAEARERALEKALSQKANSQAREHAERFMAERFTGASRDNGMTQSFSSSDPHKFDGTNDESAERCRVRLERHQRTMERAAKALAEKNMRDLLAQKEQAERNRLAEALDADVKRWSSGKEGNLRALLSTLQYILGPDSGWQPISLTEIITTSAVKKAYRKATLYVHPDKLQQRGASIQQKYICEKVFDLLKAAWNKFNSEER
uniref:Putative auxilin-like protein 1 n=1 Tax=Davidia involucrata TaxID=16924 RepID=A0A5B7AA32_DAVIN